MNAARSRPAPSVARPVVRAAIYCRKSTTKGLDQEFSSLDAQREACERYIAAQQHLGWVPLPQRYDDGGFSGANLERPAFRQLLADIESGHIDVVVVYKVDRLSRSLLDFAQLIDRFEAKDVAFVSVTQSFNTADAMGRLTLNILLSFAQFEREMIGERTRDKIQAARRRGKWTGGAVPLGYDSVDKKLAVNQAEAIVVRKIYEAYLQTRSANRVVAALAQEGHRGRRGRTISKAAVLGVLRNVLYTGQIRAGDELVEGEHQGLVSVADFERVQAILTARRPAKGRHHNAAYLLAGRLRCARCGSAYSPASTRKGGRVYRYYRCGSRDKAGAVACDAGALAAEEIEAFVVGQLQGLARDPALVVQVTAALEDKVVRETAQLRAEQRVLPQEVARLSQECEGLVSSLSGASGPVRAAIDRKLLPLGEALEAKQARLVEVEARLLALEVAAADAQWVAQALGRFDEVWALMTDDSKKHFVHALVDRVEVDEPMGDVAVVLSEVGGQLQEVA